MFAARRFSIAVVLGCLVWSSVAPRQTAATELERLTPSPTQLAAKNAGPLVIPAPGPERGVNVDERGRSPRIAPSWEAKRATCPSIGLFRRISCLVARRTLSWCCGTTARIAVEELEVTPALPPGFRFIKSTPQMVKMVDDQPLFQVAELTPQEEIRIRLRLRPERVGSSRGQAKVTFKTSSSTGFHVVEPKLKIGVEGPATAIVGSQAIFNVTVSNPGSGRAENVALNVELPDGLVRAAKGSKYGLGILNPSETRTIRIVGNVAKLGKLTSAFVATADNGLRDTAEKDVIGQGAKLDVAISGPEFRYVARPATYVVRVKNEGTTAAENSHLSCSVPKPFAFLAADERGSFDAATKNINWFLGRLDVGEEVEISFQLKSLAPGEFPIVAAAKAERGLNSEAQHVTRVEGIAAILLEVVDVDDPVEVGAETMYEILITNQGNEFAKAIRISAKVPVGMDVTGLTGPSAGRIAGQNVEFAPLPKLAPRADAVYRIKVRGNRQADFRIEVQATAETLDSPVTELESTKVYQD